MILCNNRQYGGKNYDNIIIIIINGTFSLNSNRAYSNIRSVDFNTDAVDSSRCYIPEKIIQEKEVTNRET